MPHKSPQLFTSEKKDWQTPVVILDRVRKIGVIALDPCAGKGSLVQAKVELFGKNGLADDGLHADWKKLSHGGLVFVNWPYGLAENKLWARKVADEAAKGCEIVILVANRTSEAWLQNIILAAKPDSCGFVHNRLRFSNCKHVATFGSVLFYFGSRAAKFNEAFVDLCWVIPKPKRGNYPLTVRKTREKKVVKAGRGRPAKVAKTVKTTTLSLGQFKKAVRKMGEMAKESLPKAIAKVSLHFPGTAPVVVKKVVVAAPPTPVPITYRLPLNVRSLQPMAGKV